MDQAKKDADLKWAIIYNDKSVFTNLDGSWEDAPAWGVQAIIYATIHAEVGWEIAVTGDYYTRVGDEFLPLGRDSLMDHAANVWKTIKVGRQLSQSEWYAAHKVASDIFRDLVKNRRNPDGQC